MISQLFKSVFGKSFGHDICDHIVEQYSTLISFDVIFSRIIGNMFFPISYFPVAISIAPWLSSFINVGPPALQPRSDNNLRSQIASLVA